MRALVVVGVHPRSFGSLAFDLGIVKFISRRWFHSRALWGSLGSIGVVRVRPRGS